MIVLILTLISLMIQGVSILVYLTASIGMVGYGTLMSLDQFCDLMSWLSGNCG